MTNGWTTANLREGIKRVSEKIAECADELNKLDGMLGDGDLGVTVARGFRSLVDELPNLPDDVGMALLKCAQAFTRVSGSTYGTLLATGMMSAAKTTRGKTVISWREISPLLAEAINAMARRGKSQLSDKTLLAAIEGARQATEGLDNPDEIVKAANAGVAMALEQFRHRPSRQGRARIWGEKSIGLDDPGMVAFKRIVEGLL